MSRCRKNKVLVCGKTEKGVVWLGCDLVAQDRTVDFIVTSGMGGLFCLGFVFLLRPSSLGQPSTHYATGDGLELGSSCLCPSKC